RLHRAGSFEMTLCRSWAVESGSSTSSMIRSVISGSVAMWLMPAIASATVVSRVCESTLMGPSGGGTFTFTQHRPRMGATLAGSLEVGGVHRPGGSGEPPRYGDNPPGQAPTKKGPPLGWAAPDRDGGSVSDAGSVVRLCRRFQEEVE